MDPISNQCSLKPKSIIPNFHSLAQKTSITHITDLKSKSLLPKVYISADIEPTIKIDTPASHEQLRPPPQDQYTVENPTINIIDMDIIKTTALFIAKNGQKFLTAITEKEAKNGLFDFLKPTHIYFGYFTALVDAYSRCIIPKKDEISKLELYISDSLAILGNCGERYEYEKQQREHLDSPSHKNDDDGNNIT